MANICEFKGKIVAEKKENIEQLAKWFKATYSYLNGNIRCSEEHHFWRVSSFSLGEILFDGTSYYAFFDGACAWSVQDCMLDYPFSYQRENRQEFGDRNKGITLVQASKELDLSVQIFGCECGWCFYENYVFEKGTITHFEKGDYSEVCIDEYDDYEVAKERYEKESQWRYPVTKEKFEAAKRRGDSYVVVCDIDFDDLPYLI